MLDGLKADLRQKTIDKVKDIINIDLGEITKTDSNNVINET